MTYLSLPHVGSCNFSHSIFSNLTSLLLSNILGKFPDILIIYDSVANMIEKKKANYELHVIAIVI